MNVKLAKDKQGENSYTLTIEKLTRGKVLALAHILDNENLSVLEREVRDTILPTLRQLGDQ